MSTRRSFIKSTIAGGLLLSSNIIKASDSAVAASLIMPEESEQHKRTWMSFVANDYIWSKKQIPEVKRNLVLIAKTIAKYEPVSMLVSPDDYEEAITLLGDLTSHKYPIDLIKFTTDDLWLRDTGPTFVKGSANQKVGINFNFNGWGEKQEHTYDSKVADFISNNAKAIIKTTDLTLEGGCFEIDGHGTAMLTKSCVLNRVHSKTLTS